VDPEAALFRALADPGRRRLLDRLNDSNGQNLQQLASGMGITRQAVTKHLAILESANLVTSVRRGRERLHYLNPVPINEIAERWISAFDRGRVAALSDLKRVLEEEEMEKPSFVYTTYIRTTPERLWQVLTDPEFMRRWWTVSLDTDWQVGSQVTWDNDGLIISDPEQVVLEYSPHRRLAYTWHSFTPEWQARGGTDDQTLAQLNSEPRSRVAFELEQLDEMVRLTVLHDGFEIGSRVARMVSAGWPLVISSLKSFIETGEPLDVAGTRQRARSAASE
jgi:uncharacterized protein YndB with AHSA1/START domain